MPNHIRENLPEELSDLPADLIYATDLAVHIFSRSKAVHRRAEVHDRVLLEQGKYLNLGIPWPQWLEALARSTRDDYRRVRQMQEDAMKWVEENRSPTPASSSSSSDEEAGEEDPQNNPAP